MKKKLLKLLTILFICTTLAGVFVACAGSNPTGSLNSDKNSEQSSGGSSDSTPNSSSGGPSQEQTTGIAFKTLTVSDGVATGNSLPNATEEFSFVEEMQVGENAEFTVALDEAGTQTVESKVVALAEGDNEFYVFASVDGKTTTYKVVLRRRPMYTVLFNANGGTDVESQEVEEGSFANEPEALMERTAYEFDGWDYDFSNAITGDTTVNAVWKAITYTVSFDMGHDVANPNADFTTYTAESGKYDLSAPQDIVVSNENYERKTEFSHWEMDGQEVTSIESGSYGNKTIKAVWNDYLYFGEFPQTIKPKNVTLGNKNSKGYYTGSDGCYYTQVWSTPSDSTYTFSDKTTIKANTYYWFKVEPIRWQILKEEGGKALLLCDSIISATYYNKEQHVVGGMYVPQSNYKESYIRSYLNNFFKTAFTSSQQNMIQTTTVDNSVESTGNPNNAYACENTQDKVFLLSYAEVTGSEYGFDYTFSVDAIMPRLQKKPSDYALALGANKYVYPTNPSRFDDERCDGYGDWWLRTPHWQYGDRAVPICSNGAVGTWAYTKDTLGVVPALQIQL